MTHFWEWCPGCCCYIVICGKCGNNTCNAGHGTIIVDGKEVDCDLCPEAHELDSKGPPENLPKLSEEEIGKRHSNYIQEINGMLGVTIISGRNRP